MLIRSPRLRELFPSPPIKCKMISSCVFSQVYKRRWYVLIMYSMYAFTQSAVWNTWGPISDTSEDAFGWGDGTIAWLNNWGPVSYVLTGLFYPWFLQVKGKWSVLFLMTDIRYITVPSFCYFILHFFFLLRYRHLDRKWVTSMNRTISKNYSCVPNSFPSILFFF